MNYYCPLQLGFEAFEWLVQAGLFVLAAAVLSNDLVCSQRHC